MSETKVTSAQGSLLCLKCRHPGHIVLDCPAEQWYSGDRWYFDDARRNLNFESGSMESDDVLCARCEELDVVQMLRGNIPWQRTSELNKSSVLESDYVKNLGKTGSIQFWSGCRLCCCLFVMAAGPHSVDQDVLVFPFWSMSRLAGEDDVFIDLEAAQQRFAKCLMVVLREWPKGMEGLPFSTVSHRGDALCVVEEDLEFGEVLGGRVVDPQNLDINLVKKWVSSCSQFEHVECQPGWSEDLQTIRLIDVNAEVPKVIQYPYRSCKYIALSYVWGEIKQRGFQLNSVVPEEDIPKTIKDAMGFCRRMSIPYLWVDSICIDQSSSEHKKIQIPKMKSIYSGSYLTLIALSGASAQEGLPKLSSPSKMFSQISCRIKSKRLVGTMPTLSHQIWKQPWGSRAWTLQEALLSPRCLYISHHQLQYECNGMQCCESLDETKSYTHQSPNDKFDTLWATWRHERVGAGCLRGIKSRPSDRLNHYNRKLILYRYRSMRESTDAIHAFLGILQHLEVLYKKSFFQGLPIEDLHWGLLWRIRRRDAPRVKEFPSWSWAGWEGWITPGGPYDEGRTDRYPLDIQMWRASKDGTLEQIFDTPTDSDGGSIHPDSSFLNDPITETVSPDSEDHVFDEKLYRRGFEKDYLFIEAIVFRFAADYTTALITSVEETWYLNVIGAANCFIQIRKDDSEIEKAPVKQEFLLLARERQNNFVFHHLLLLKYEQDDAAVATRGTVVSLGVPHDKLVVLKELEPKKRRVVLS